MQKILTNYRFGHGNENSEEDFEVAKNMNSIN